MRERYVVINGSINGKELTVSTKKNPERKLQTDIGKVVGDFQNQQKIQKNDREQRLAGIYYNRGRSFSTCQAYGYPRL